MGRALAIRIDELKNTPLSRLSRQHEGVVRLPRSPENGTVEHREFDCFIELRNAWLLGIEGSQGLFPFATETRAEVSVGSKARALRRSVDRGRL